MNCGCNSRVKHSKNRWEIDKKGYSPCAYVSQVTPLNADIGKELLKRYGL